MFDRFFRFAVSRLVGARRRQENREAVRFCERETPELLRAYAGFRVAQQSGNVRQPYKGWDLWRILDRFRPQHIAEMGSGTTSAVFALWAKRHQARYVAYESHAGWAKVSEDCLRQAGLVDGPSPVRMVPGGEREDGNSTGFADPIPSDADFVYVDGPPCRLEDGRKVPNDDVVRLLDRGGRPRVIVVDGRLETVDLIRKHPEGRRYRYELSFVYCLQRGRWLEGLKGREHTVFVRDAS